MDHEIQLLIHKAQVNNYADAIQLDFLSIAMYSMFTISVILLFFFAGYFIGKEIWRNK